MIPLYDESAPGLRPPYITITLIIINTLIFFWIFFFTNFEKIIFQYGMIPNLIWQGKGLITLFTSMFLHAGFIHLAGNMWFLWLFGDNLEDQLGKIRYIIFYLLTGIIASIVHVLSATGTMSIIPAVGASGAISGLLGGYIVLFPKNKIRAFIIIVFRPILFNVSAYVYIVIWFIYQLLYMGQPTSIAYMAHIGGFISGIFLVLLFKRNIIRQDFYHGKPPLWQ